MQHQGRKAHPFESSRTLPGKAGGGDDTATAREQVSTPEETINRTDAPDYASSLGYWGPQKGVARAKNGILATGRSEGLGASNMNLKWDTTQLPFPVGKIRHISFSSVQFSRSVVSDSLRPHESQHARPPCPSPTPGVHPNPCPSSR